MRGVFFGAVALFACSSFVTFALYGCGSSNPAPAAGNDVTCGPGTTLDANVCYPSTGPATTSDDSGAAEDTSAPPDNDSGTMSGGRDSATDGGDSSVSATAAPTFAGITSVGPASSSSLQVTWAAATDPLATVAKPIVYDVYVGTAKGGENFSAPTVTTAPGSESAVIQGLTMGSTYYVVVRAKDTATGLEDKNTVEIGGEPQADTKAPSFGGATSAVAAAQGSIKLAWSAAIDDLTPTPGIGYFVYQSSTPGGENFNVPSYATDPGATSYSVQPLSTPNVPYYFVVRAHDAAGNIDGNTTEVMGTPGPDTLPPVFGGCVSAVTQSSTQVTVTWDPGTDNTTPQPLIAYDVFAATASGQEDFSTPSASFTGTSLGVVTHLLPSTMYYFVCRAHDLSNNEDTNTFERTATTPVDMTPPTFAGLTMVTNVEATTAQLNWAAATDPQTDQADMLYDVYQATTAGGENFATPSATSAPGATSINLSGLPSSTTLYWVVRARDEAGNEDTNTVELSATTQVSFANDVQPIFSQHCAVVGCHVPGDPPEGQVLAAGFAYSNVVNVQSVEVPTLNRVTPSNLGQSYLYDKITAMNLAEGTSYMPPATTDDELTAAEKNTIMNWIQSGALNN
jgi:hypothetical protein